MRTKDILLEIRALGMTQAEIARLTGIPQPRLSRWEGGDVPRTADDSLALAELHKRLVVDRETGAAAKPELVGVDAAPAVREESQ